MSVSSSQETQKDRPEASHEPQWFVYLIECVNGSIYTGITKNVASRYAKHTCGKGARYTRAHPPLQLLASWAFPSHSSALKAEYRIKQLNPAQKRSLARQSGCIPPDDPGTKPGNRKPPV